MNSLDVEADICSHSIEKERDLIKSWPFQSYAKSVEISPNHSLQFEPTLIHRAPNIGKRM